MAPDVEAAIALQPYVVRVVFADGAVRDVDIEPLLSGPVFESLRDPATFASVSVDETGDTITWPNGADLDPDVIYGTAPADWEAPVRVSVPQLAQGSIQGSNLSEGEDNSENLTPREDAGPDLG